MEELGSALKITGVFFIFIYNLSQLYIKEVEKKKKVVLLDTRWFYWFSPLKIKLDCRWSLKLNELRHALYGRSVIKAQKSTLDISSGWLMHCLQAVKRNCSSSHVHLRL